MTAPVTTPEETVDADTSIDPDRPWIVLVWNDPINLMSYVTHVLQKLFGYDREKATMLMLDVHEKGRVSAPRTRPVGHTQPRQLRTTGTNTRGSLLSP